MTSLKSKVDVSWRHQSVSGRQSTSPKDMAPSFLRLSLVSFPSSLYNRIPFEFLLWVADIGSILRVPALLYIQTWNRVFNHLRVIYIHMFPPPHNYLPVSLPAMKPICFVSSSFLALRFHECGRRSSSNDLMWEPWWWGGIVMQCWHGQPSSSHWDQPHARFHCHIYLPKKSPLEWCLWWMFQCSMSRKHGHQEKHF